MYLLDYILIETVLRYADDMRCAEPNLGISHSVYKFLLPLLSRIICMCLKIIIAYLSSYF
jgi:hypothetical protein